MANVFERSTGAHKMLNKNMTDWKNGLAQQATGTDAEVPETLLPPLRRLKQTERISAAYCRRGAAVCSPLADVSRGDAFFVAGRRLRQLCSI
jgi:hypothetical protein